MAIISKTLLTATASILQKVQQHKQHFNEILSWFHDKLHYFACFKALIELMLDCLLHI